MFATRRNELGKEHIRPSQVVFESLEIDRRGGRRVGVAYDGGYYLATRERGSVPRRSRSTFKFLTART